MQDILCARVWFVMHNFLPSDSKTHSCACHKASSCRILKNIQIHIDLVQHEHYVSIDNIIRNFGRRSASQAGNQKRLN